MNKPPKAFRSMNSRALLLTLLVAEVALTACGGGEPEKAAKATPSTTGQATPPPPPIYSSAHIKANLIPPGDVRKGMQEIRVALDGLRDGKVPSCSLSAVRLPGNPEITTRQLTRQAAKPSDELRYAQLIARYDNAQAASAAFEALHQKARSCPPKRHVPAKRLKNKSYVFSHNDTWRTESNTVLGWRHLRGYERQVVPPSQTTHNVFFVMYDYAVQGNVVLGTLYMERTEPKKSGDPIARRATEVLTKQVQRFSRP